MYKNGKISSLKTQIYTISFNHYIIYYITNKQSDYRISMKQQHVQNVYEFFVKKISQFRIKLTTLLKSSLQYFAIK